MTVFATKRITEPKVKFSSELFVRQRDGLLHYGDENAVGGRPLSMAQVLSMLIDDRFKAMGYTDYLPKDQAQ